MNINSFDIYANESVTLKDNAFKNVTISSLNINTNDSAVFDLSYFQQYNYYQNFEIHACKDVSFLEHSFQYANIGSMKLYSNGSVKFTDESFRIIEHFNELEIRANESITFDQKSFSYSDVNSIKLYSNQSINFYEDSFYATSVQIIEIHALRDIFFETHSFQGSLDSLKLNSNGNISLDYKSFDHHGRTINDLEIYSIGDIILMDK